MCAILLISLTGSNDIPQPLQKPAPIPAQPSLPILAAVFFTPRQSEHSRSLTKPRALPFASAHPHLDLHELAMSDFRPGPGDVPKLSTPCIGVHKFQRSTRCVDAPQSTQQIVWLPFPRQLVSFPFASRQDLAPCLDPSQAHQASEQGQQCLSGMALRWT
jgi:hypothetical protein